MSFLKASDLSSSNGRSSKVEQLDDEELEPIEDKTEPLLKRSKRTERVGRRQALKERKYKAKSHVTNILDLPYELVLDIFSYCQPSTLFRLCRVSKAYQATILQGEAKVAGAICDVRYGCLRKCFHTPMLLRDVDPSKHAALQDMTRVELKTATKKPYQHIQPPDPDYLCTCFVCLLRWNSLNIILDFAHWQDHLDKGEPIPIIPRGRYPAWNAELVDEHAAKVRKALESPLWHARLLEEHLKSTTRAIKRHAANKGNKRRRFRMTPEDVASETDHFLERSGPPTADIPFTRDNYYMLEAYLPNRGWSSEMQRWMYIPKEQHDTDVNIVIQWANWRRGLGKTGAV